MDSFIFAALQENEREKREVRGCVISQRVRSPQSVRRFPFPLFSKRFHALWGNIPDEGHVGEQGRWSAQALLTSCVDARVIPLGAPLAAESTPALGSFLKVTLLHQKTQLPLKKNKKNTDLDAPEPIFHTVQFHS